MARKTATKPARGSANAAPGNDTYKVGEVLPILPPKRPPITELGVPRDPNYHFSVDITNKAMAWVRATRSLTPDRPLFIYYAAGGAHPPHPPPKEWLDKYKGQFDQGWDKLREEILERQIKMGLMKPGTKIITRFGTPAAQVSTLRAETASRATTPAYLRSRSHVR